MKGGGAAGVATLGAAGVEVAQQVLAETQTAILPLVPYLDTLRWVFIAVALGGIAVTIYARLDDWRGGGGDRGLLTGIAASPWMRAALRYGAIVLAVLLFLLRFGAPASARAASPNALRPRRRPMMSNAGCWRRRLAALAIATSLLSGCATVGSDGRRIGAARPWSSTAVSSRRGRLRSWPCCQKGSAIAEMLADYAVMREQARAGNYIAGRIA
jgi:hypothetical protein